MGPLLVVLALSKVHAAWVADPPYDYTGSFRFAWSLGYAVVLAVAAYGVGLPDVPRGARAAVGQALLASSVAAATVSAVQLVAGDALLPRFVVLGSALLVVPVHLGCWRIAGIGRSRGEVRDRLFVVAAQAELGQLEADLSLSPERPAVVVGRMTPDEAIGGGAEKPLVTAVLAARATVVVMDRVALLQPDVVDQASSLHEVGLRVRTMVELYGGWLGKLPVSELERASLFFDISEVHRIVYGRAKRLIDLACGVVLLVPLVVAVPFVLLGNLVRNQGPLLFRQSRVGRGGRPFEILKFRTMAVTPDQEAGARGEWTSVDDPRVTPFGRLLRGTHVDELPQAINILRGDLSVVGPRPEQPAYATELSAKLPFYGMRHLVRPGLTGWAQVKYGYAGDERDALEKLQYEFFYLRNQSLRFDLRVIGRTVRSVIGGAGRGR